LLILSKLDDAGNALLDNIVKLPIINRSTKDKDGKIQEQKISAEKKINYCIEKTEKSTFYEVFNEASNYAATNNYKWFSVIEHDDVVDINWYGVFNTYAEEKTEVDIFLPITKEISNGTKVGFINEFCWYEPIGAEVAGVTDLQILLRFNCLNLTCGVIKTDSVKKYSENKDGLFYPLKESMKISAMYEFFLRSVYNDFKIFTIPRAGYEHRINRTFDIVDNFSSKLQPDLTSKPVEKGGINRDEFWMELAKKEYFFDHDRKLSYTNSLEVGK